MSWYHKEQPTPFDSLPLAGLFFLDGDMLAHLFSREWIAGQKFPMIAFPSGVECEVWESRRPEQGGIVHLFGEMDLPLHDTCDKAHERAANIAEACGYGISKVGDNQLEVWGRDLDEHLLITYDNDIGEMIDVGQRPMQPDELPVHPAHQLMTPEIRELLPPLFSNEDKGLDAVAPIKYFAPASGWTWYATEFDGEDILFGLVVGYEVELGSFSLSELQSVRGGLNLPVERDLYYKPKTLRELIDQHRRERGS